MIGFSGHIGVFVPMISNLFLNDIVIITKIGNKAHISRIPIANANKIFFSVFICTASLFDFNIKFLPSIA